MVDPAVSLPQGPGGVCQACRRAPVEAEIVDEDEPDHPYLLCSSCARRLRHKALRPREWYHLVILHGTGTYYLGDSFYSSDGTAEQPDAPVEQPEKHPLPTLPEVQEEAEALIDFALAAGSLDEAIGRALARHDPGLLLDSVRRRMPDAAASGNDVRLLEICRVLGHTAAEWIRECWQSWTPDLLGALAEASAACLPFDEGFRRVSGLFEDEGSRRRILASFHGRTRTYCYLLAPFRSPRTLDWMETHPALLDAENPHWGRLAALSQFSWSTAQRWLARGVPLSHLAVAALLACRRYDTGLLMQHRPVLLGAPPDGELFRELDAYCRADPAPEVGDQIAKIRQGFWQLGQAPRT